MSFLRMPVVAGLVLAGSLIPVSSNAQEAAAGQKDLKALDPKLMDTSVDPCVNFYQYSCGTWLKQNPIPADESSYGRSTELEDQNRLVLKSILEKAATGGSERTPNEQKIGDYYATCMDGNAVNEAGLKPLQPVLDRISALGSKDGLPELTAYLDSIGIGTLFDFGSDQDFKDATREIAVFYRPISVFRKKAITTALMRSQ